ncbi:MAG: hypothetical protein OEV01_04245 [Nitrospira sp.]|nr:hypothetical protein [Nitrospira sp.]MDH4304147.1 hypothetical protein [Nitrospira sp.]MDH5194779.1 hypothetical protein [Nitrospira sp.]
MKAETDQAEAFATAGLPDAAAKAASVAPPVPLSSTVNLWPISA